MDIKSLLPTSVLSKAYEFNSEYAWRPEDVSELASALKEKKIAVLGGEVWEKTDNAPIISSDIYQWASRQKNNDESWDDYVTRTVSEMIKFIEGLPKDKSFDKNIYVNIQMAEQS